MNNYNIGDKVRVVRVGMFVRDRLLHQIGEIQDLRRYPYPSTGEITHYVVKFPCYKIAHIYYVSEIDNCCELVERAKQDEVREIEPAKVRVRPEVRIRREYLLKHKQ